MRAVIRICLEQRWVVLGLALLFMGLAGRSLATARFDAFPEFAPPRVEIQTEAPGLSTEEVEALVTTPLEAALAGTPGMTTIRSRSVLGLSSVVLLFPSGTNLLDARALVQERVTRATPTLPSVARAPVLLSPLSSTSRIMKIGMWSTDLSDPELSDLARWQVRPALMAVPGVANVAVWGEKRRRLEVQVDPDRAAAHAVDVSQLVSTVRDALMPKAGGLVDLPTTRLPVIHAPLIADAEDLAELSLARPGTTALRLDAVATIRETHAVPIGAALVTQGSGVLLIVEKQPGASTLQVTQGVDVALDQLRPGMPRIEFDPTIFRPAGFIERAISNLTKALGLGCLLVIAILVVFLWNLRTALISVLAIPLSLLSASFVFTAMGWTIDTMVIAGLVIALGEVVDDAIIDVENIHRRLGAQGRPVGLREATKIVLSASLEVRSAIVFASIIVVLVFIPVLLMGGVAGAFFRPLAIAYGLAILASTLTALTITPALALILLPRATSAATRSPLADWLVRSYEPILRAGLKRPRSLVGATIALLMMASVVGASLREQFLPSFAENDFLMHWVARPGTSLEAVTRTADLARKELLTIPGVRNFGAHIGRAEVADEVVGPNFGELWISIDPGFDVDATADRVREVVDGYPGVFRDVQTYLQERMREVLSGGGSPIVVRFHGQDVAALRMLGEDLALSLETVPGVAHARPEAQVLVPQVRVRVDLRSCAAFGVDPGLVRSRVATMIAGDSVGQIIRDQQPLEVVVWGSEALRNDVASIRDIAITDSGRVVARLGDVADVEIVPAPNTIAHDSTVRKLDVFIDLQPTADLASVVRAVEMRTHDLQIPEGHRAEVLGEGLARADARARLLGSAVLAVVGIFFVLLADFRSTRIALLVLAGLPFALVGGVMAAGLSGVVSLGTLVGLVAVIGIAARNGIMLVSHFRHLEFKEQVPLGAELVLRGARERLTPILMTALATGLALLPVVLAGPRAGNEIEHPMAVTILGGLVSSTVLTLIVTPSIYAWLGRPGRVDPLD